MSTGKRFVCIHGHFYQPPRENPWLEAIEVQDAAHPYHDWNARIWAECYAPNAVSRILDEKGHILQMVNNYSKISFDFGPTLLRWMESNTPYIYKQIVQADQESQNRFSGHGSALAQSYHHSILPLCNPRDRYTEVFWGIRDFEYRFGRKPEGMWLPETAVDTETLEILAELGIQFTILSPYQARRTRKIGERSWKDVSNGSIDPRRAYKLLLPSHRTINAFFYDGPIARAVAFERLLSNGEQFAHRLIGTFSEEEDDQLVHIATDGETYGHHHRHGEMALSYALHYIEKNDLARLTNYPEYLQTHPPEYYVQILENTSWSCTHGIERWRSDCGCRTAGPSQWNQSWRTPLREALDGLRDRLASEYEREAGKLLQDPWRARNEYVEVVLCRRPQTIETFLTRQARKELSLEEKIRTIKLMELQRHALLMYTSCGWFFNELSGIETVQVLQYAGRAIQLAEEVFTGQFEATFLEKLAQAKSNIPEHLNGERIYLKFVKPTRVELIDVAAHYAITSLFEPQEENTRIYCYTVDQQEYQDQEAGKAKLAIGKARVSSNTTHDAVTVAFGVVYFGDHNLNCGVRPWAGDDFHKQLLGEAGEVFSKADFPATLRLLDRYFGEHTYSLKSMFRDQRRKILNRILETTIGEVETQYQYIYERQAPLMRFLADLNMPLPGVFRSAAEVFLNTNLRKTLEEEPPDPERVSDLLKEAKERNIALETENLSFVYMKTLERMIRHFQQEPPDVDLLEDLGKAVDICRLLPSEVNLWTVQNIYYEILKEKYPQLRRDSNPDSGRWVKAFRALGEKIYVRVDP